MKTINITAYTDNPTQVDAIKAFMKALKIRFEVSKDTPYDPEFVEKILQGKEDIEQGKGISLSIEEMNDLCK